jgi:VirK protein
MGNTASVSARLRLSILALLIPVIGASVHVHAAGHSVKGNSYQEFFNSVVGGKPIYLKIDLASCKAHGTDTPGPSVVGIQHFENFMIRPDKSVAFSTTHFTVRNDNTAVNEFLSFIVSPDGKVALHNKFLEASTNKLLRESEYDCELGNGITFGINQR